MKKKKIALLIAFRVTEYNLNNAVKDLTDCLKSIIYSYSTYSDILENEHNFSIYILDDYSTVEYQKLIPISLKSKVCFISNENEQGHGNTLNFGLNKIDADYYLFTDSDCIVKINWVFLALNSFKDNKRTCIVGPNWYHQTPINKWLDFITSSESKLMKFIFESYIDYNNNTCVRIDCRNLIIKKDFLELFPNKIFFSDAIYSNSGQTSYNWRQGEIKMSNIVGYNSNLMVYHKHPDSFFQQIVRYYKRGRFGDFDFIYSNIYNSLRSAFFKHYFKRHFISPILSSNVSFIYLWTVHSAYWFGILIRHFERKLKPSHNNKKLTPTCCNTPCGRASSV